MKKMVGLLLVMAVLLSALSVTVSASDSAPFSFALQTGGGSAYTASAYKNDYIQADVYPSSGTVSSSNRVAMRIRTSGGTHASGLYVRSSLSSFAIWYYDDYCAQSLDL
ncbi:MAG: hypothetical protein ACERKO_10990 [Acetanaerobacterium sp.]